MKIHNQLIYHCERCGRLVHQEPEVPRPACCDTPMTQAAATTVIEDDGFDSEADADMAEDATGHNPRKPK